MHELFKDIPPGGVLLSGGFLVLLLKELLQRALPPITEAIVGWFKGRGAQRLSESAQRLAEQNAEREHEGRDQDRLQHQLEECEKRYAALLDRLERKDVLLDEVQEKYRLSELDLARKDGEMEIMKLEMNIAHAEEKLQIYTQFEHETRELQQKLLLCEQLNKMASEKHPDEIAG